MRDFNELSGPWVGLSTQDGLRISEAIRLLIQGGRIWGEGSDQDGDFVVSGSHTSGTNAVHLVRTYRRTNEPSQDSVGIPFDYHGIWDGEMVSGYWQEREYAVASGPFEMWPQLEEEGLESMFTEEIARA